MGADMHLMVDYDTASKPTEWGFLLSLQRRAVTPFKNSDRVISLFETAISPPQDYRMFAALAGVRAHENEHPLIAPRGFPDVSSSETFNEFHMCVVGDSERDLWPRDIRQSCANELVDKGVARVVIPPGRSAAWLTDPSFHSPGWLTHQEIVAALDHCGYERSDLSVEFRIVLSAMDMLDQEYGTDHTRLVFWFDN